MSKTGIYGFLLLRTNVQNVHSTYIGWNIWSVIFLTPLS